jgi:hypothetical protein
VLCVRDILKLIEMYDWFVSMHKMHKIDNVVVVISK